MNYKETSDLWRLYRREWVIVHTVDGDGDPECEPPSRPVFDQATTFIREHLSGRVRDEDVKLVMNTDGHDKFWCHVQVYKDTLKGEFKHVEHAQFFAVNAGYEEYVIVPRNSKSDHNLRSYGVVKL